MLIVIQLLNPRPVRTGLPNVDSHPVQSVSARMGGQTSTSQASQQTSANHGIFIRKNKAGIRQRQIKPPQWQSNYVADGIVERLRITRVEQNGASTSANDVIEVPSTSTQQTPQQAISAPQIEVRLDQDMYDSDKVGIACMKMFAHLSFDLKTGKEYSANHVLICFTLFPNLFSR